MVKRIFDIVFTLIVFVLLLWWCIPLIALMVYWATGKPVFFLQKRTGYNGKTFTCYKYRTMVVNDQQDILQASIDDPRITKIGHVLRETNLDELPQFLNVLKGDMSIVGPRPHMLNHTSEFESKIPDYHKRHLVKPGITGLAQIKGFRGPTPNRRSIYKRVQWDVYYVNNNNVLMDAYITINTAAHLIKRLNNWNK